MKIDAAIVRVEPKVGSTLPVFSAPPIDVVVLSNLNDKELLSVAKQAGHMRPVEEFSEK